MIRPLRAVGLDLSTAAAAIAATHDSAGLPRLATWTIPGTAARPLHVQIDIIEMAVRRACGYGSGNVALGGRPDVVIIEGTFSRPGASDYPLHALQGVVRQWLHRQHIPYTVAAPATLKVYATGSGATSGENKVTKDKVITEVLATYGALLHINPRDDNQADAITALALCLDAYGQPLAEVPRGKRRAVSAVTWPDLQIGAAA